MKRTALILTATLVSVTLAAQRSDIYSSAGKVETSIPAPKETVYNAASAPAPAPAASAAPVTASDVRDVDEYNRRYAYSASAASSGNDGNASYNAVETVHDTVYVNDGSYMEGYNDASEDYEYALRMLRFHGTSVRISLSPIYWHLAIFDPWFDPWFDSWYYDPWYYDPWHPIWRYDPWYPVWRPIPTPIYYVPGPGPVVYRRDRFIADREMNRNWDRKLTSASVRETSDSRRSVATESRLGAVQRSETDRGLVSTQPSSESRTRISSSSAYSGRSRGNTSETPTRNLNSTVSRNVSSGSSYDRPSSTERNSSGVRTQRTVSRNAVDVSGNSRTSSRSSSSVSRSSDASSRSSSVSSETSSRSSSIGSSIGSSSRSSSIGSSRGSSIGSSMGSSRGSSMGSGSMGGGSRGGSSYGGRR